MPPVVRAQLDYYAVLEIAASADLTEINAAFRRLAWRFHPDRNSAPGSTLQFQDINEAHQVLSDPARRAEYDAKWHPKREEPYRPQPTVRHRRRGRRLRFVRPVVMTLCALVIVCSAWTLIFAAMNAAHAGVAPFSFGKGETYAGASSADCGFSMEIFPVKYIDQRGRVTTGWETDVHNCWGGSARLTNLPDSMSADISGYR